MKKLRYQDLSKEQKNELIQIGLIAMNLSDYAKERIISIAERDFDRRLYDFALSIGAKRNNADIADFYISERIMNAQKT